MRRLVWTNEALDDLEMIIAYIADRNPVAADQLRTDITDTANRILERPLMYRPGRVEGTREAVVHPNYILVYCVGEETIEVAAVLHVRRQYPWDDPDKWLRNS